MKRKIAMSGALAVLLAGGIGASAQPVLTEVAVNVNGTVTDSQGQVGNPIVAGVTFTGSFQTDNTGTGLGSIIYSVASAGTYSFSAFLDIDSNPGNALDDTGSAHGTLAAGQTWEIGDPTGLTDIVTPPNDIASDFSAGALANGITGANPGDVATALGFNFTVPAGDTAVVELDSSTTAPGGNTFYLTQSGGGNTEYFSGSVTISPAGTGGSVPDSGSTLSALALAFAGLAGLKSKLGRS